MPDVTSDGGADRRSKARQAEAVTGRETAETREAAAAHEAAGTTGTPGPGTAARDEGRGATDRGSAASARPQATGPLAGRSATGVGESAGAAGEGRARAARAGTGTGFGEDGGRATTAAGATPGVREGSGTGLGEGGRARTAEGVTPGVREGTGTGLGVDAGSPASGEGITRVPREGTGTAGREGTHGHGGPLLAHDESDKLALRLQHAVGGFVDGPRTAVEEADQVLEEVAARFTDAITQRRRTLQASWQRAGDSKGTETDTEQLRLALRDYREMAERLLHT
ncbi:hypothetical protein ACFVYF_03240 [Streptomyces sp. NPDC058274]|uniref:hypothetical protein n=1 Tax=Streptomyces sp. NPDC058274 TaxID=3346416 RepID=UPI0036E703AB